VAECGSDMARKRPVAGVPVVGLQELPLRRHLFAGGGPDYDEQLGEPISRTDLNRSGIREDVGAHIQRGVAVPPAGACDRR